MSKRPRRSYYARKMFNNNNKTAERALKVAYYTKKLLNVEFKEKSFVYNQTAIPAASIGSVINTLSQGTGIDAREGDQVKWTSILLRYIISINSAASDTSVRVFMILDRQPNQGGFGLSDFLAAPGQHESIVSPLNLGNKYRFKILYDKVHQMSINGRRNIRGEFFKRIEIRTRYASNNGDFSDITTNSIALFMVSDETVNTPATETYVRLRFLDN